MQNTEWLPEMFRFVALKDTVNIPLVFQLLILELAIDGLRLAAMNTPSMLSTPLSVIAGIVMGEFAVTSGWFNSEINLIHKKPNNYAAYKTKKKIFTPNLHHFEKSFDTKNYIWMPIKKEIA